MQRRFPIGINRSSSSSRLRKSWLSHLTSPAAAVGAALLLAAALAGAGVLLIEAAGLGPLTSHMGQHILLMNAVAPLLAVTATYVLYDRLPLSAAARSIVAASLVQMGLLWAWHSPAAIQAALHSHHLHVLMQASLFGSALWFWIAIVSDRSAMRWRSMLSLLLTGKLFCLIGVLLVFAPRHLYSAGAHSGHAPSATDMSDQHLAGLLMIVACPLTYLLAGVIIASRWLHEASDRAATKDIVRGPAHLTDGA